MDTLLTALRAAAEPTRLRLLCLCARGELTVTELTQILGQSQPRVSRHLKLLVEAGLLERFPEGSWAFYRLALPVGGDTDPAAIARLLVGLVPPADRQAQLDLERLAGIRAQRAEQAQRFFSANAEDWDRIRALYVDDAVVEAEMLRWLPAEANDHLDIGTGTGRILALLSPRTRRAIGVDSSRAMLAAARARLDDGALRHCSLRHADMYALPFAGASFDLVTLHQVLHYADAPEAAVAEAARVLRPGGRLLVVDFAPHGMEELREREAHRRLGFAEAEVEGWLRTAGLAPLRAATLPGRGLNVSLWLGERGTAQAPRAAAAARTRPPSPETIPATTGAPR